MIQPLAAFAHETTIRAFLEALERECSAYCLLGGYEDLPAAVHSDIDFMVSRQDFERLPRILSSLAHDVGFRLVQELQHETTARYFCLAQSRPGVVLFLHPDSSSDYRRHGKTWLRPETVLARRRKHPNGFWIPSIADDFLYYLIKRIDKQNLEARHAQQLSRLFSEDEQGCTEALNQRLTTASALLVGSAARSGNWQPVIQAIQKLDEELLANATPDSVSTRLGELKRRTRRWLQPTGLCVAVLGQDGSARSSVTGQYVPALAMAFRRTKCFSQRPGLLCSPAAAQAIEAGPMGQPPRGVLASTARLLVLWADYALGYYLRVRPLLVRSTLVVFDGHELEPLIDPQCPRYGGPRWLARLLGAATPFPDLVFVLDAPAGALQPGETIANAVPSRRAILVDPARPLGQVVDECAEHTLALLALRTAKRLHLN